MNVFAAVFVTHLLSTGMNEGAFPNNQLVGIRHDTVVVGTMINSYYERSYYAAKEFQLGNNWGIMVGAASGYDDIYNGYAPIISPYYEYEGVRASLFMDAVVVTLEFELW